MLNSESGPTIHRLYHDFNKLYPGQSAGMRSAPLICHGTKTDLDELKISFAESMEVLLYEPGVNSNGEPDELQARAKVRWDAAKKCFMADFVWAELKYRSESGSGNKVK